MDEVQQRREDAWGALKKMHDDVNGVKNLTLMAAGGWCAPSSSQVLGDLGTELIVPLSINRRG